VFRALRALAALGLMAYAQDKPQRLTFEVASIKPEKPGGRFAGVKPKPAGQGYYAEGVPLKLIINLMYKVPMKQITGGQIGSILTGGKSTQGRTIHTALTTYTRCFRICWRTSSS